MALNLLKASENAEHLKRHAHSDSLTVGSKALDGIKEEDVAQMLKVFDEAYADLIAKEGNPGRKEFCLQCDHPVGTDAVINKSDLKQGVKTVPLTRDIGTPYETEVQVVLIDPKDMPQTNLVYGIYGPYGPTGNAGIYTMIYGDPGKPFPKKLEENADEKAKAANAECEKYWQNHVFLCTPEELREAISQMSAAGKDVSRQTAALLSFETKGCVTPIAKHQAHQPTKEAVVLTASKEEKPSLQSVLMGRQQETYKVSNTAIIQGLQKKER